METPLPNYPQPFGSRNVMVSTRQGSNNYIQGSDTVTASTFGWSTFDRVAASQSFNNTAPGNCSVRVYIPAAQAPIVSANNVTGGVPTGSNNVTLRWLNNGNGAEWANNSNLAAEFVRMEYYGG